MRVPPRRFTVRLMMIMVAVVGTLLSVSRCLLWVGDSTSYADGYSDDKFILIKHGMQESEVFRILGEPLKVEEATEYIEWIYGSSHLRVSDHIEPYTLQEPVRSGSPRDYTIFIAESNGTIIFAAGGYLNVNAPKFVGSSLYEMESRFGKPLRILRETTRHYLVYSTGDASYNVRKVGIDETKRVNNIVEGWYQD